MKKFYTLLFVVLATLTVNSQIINFPDVHFKDRLLSASTSTTVAKNLAGVYFKIDTNNDGQIQVSEALQVSYLDVNGNGCSLSSCTISSMEGLQYFTNLVTLYTFNNNPITSLPIDNMTHLKTLWCYNSSLTSLNLSNLTNLEEFFCSGNQLISLDFTGLVNLKHVDADGNDFTSLTFSNLPLLNKLDVSYCALTVLGLNNLPSLQYLYCDHNQLTSLNFTSLPVLYDLLAMNNQITTFNISNNPFMHYMFLEQNPITSLFLKNGSQLSQLNITSGNFITYVCADEAEKAWVNYYINYLGGNHAEINSYCSFTPGGNYYTIQGNVKYDSNGNGCDASDANMGNLKLNVSGPSSETVISSALGNYRDDVVAGNYTFTPALENPTYFNISPTNFSAAFPANPSPVAQNICLTPNGTHQDVETWVIPMTRARPGFDATYLISYRNKGTHSVSGNLSFAFDDDYMDFISATPVLDSQSYSLLNWSYTNLAPFETRSVIATFNINTPSEILPVNIGDVLKFWSTVFPISGDEYSTDNSNNLRQPVVGSFDPNDKTCVEGNTIEPEMAGKYVHYVIRFENTGTANAENIVVKDIIDTSKFDMSTLVPLSGSAPYITRISNTNQVEFIFENINLPFDDANNDGYVAFKIKTKPTLVIGDTFSNSASIYFDYNFPIVTNTAITTIQALGTQDFEFCNVFSLSPVPAKNSLTITTKQNVTISSVNIYNTLGQLVQVDTNPNEMIDVSELKTGTYFIRIVSDKGTASSKFSKE